ncbi:MAG: 50S ribosomal protein L7/L12 [candidate division WOR-3 bacterium]
MITNESKKVTVDEIVAIIESLTVKELATLVDTLKEKFGVTPQAFIPQGVATATAPSGEAAPKEETKAEFTVTLVSVGDKKIQVLKELRALTNLGLKEAKDLIDKTPSVIKEGASKEEAEKIKAKLEEVGAKVEVK